MSYQHLEGPCSMCGGQGFTAAPCGQCHDCSQNETDELGRRYCPLKSGPRFDFCSCLAGQAVESGDKDVPAHLMVNLFGEAEARRRAQS